MTISGIALIVIAIAFLILVLMMIPAILTVKRTASSIGSLSEMLHQELKPTIQELKTVLAEMKTVGGGMAEHTDDVRRFMSALGEAGDNLHTINRSVSTMTTVFTVTSAWATGAKVAAKYMFERYLKKRGGN